MEDGWSFLSLLSWITLSPPCLQPSAPAKALPRRLQSRYIHYKTTCSHQPTACPVRFWGAGCSVGSFLLLETGHRAPGIKSHPSQHASEPAFGGVSNPGQWRRNVALTSYNLKQRSAWTSKSLLSELYRLAPAPACFQQA